MVDKVKVSERVSRLEIQAGASYRRELYEGRMHTIFPAVVAVEGVLNGALVTAAELGKFVEAWNGRPIPIFHPEVHGEHVSANYPDILERVAGTFFGAHMDAASLKGEFWLDEQRMDSLGESVLLDAMREGNVVVEVSTAYFADNVAETGEFNGKPYKIRHANLRPDHVALLPGEIGACSIADGCGVPRVNQADKGKLQTAFGQVMRALGIKPNDCNCEDDPMSNVKALAATIIANLAQLAPATRAELDAGGVKVNFDVAELEKMSEAGLGALSAAIKALLKGQAKPEDTGGDGEDPTKMKKNRQQGADQPITLGQLNDLISNAVDKAVAAALDPKALGGAIRKRELIGRLTANQACAFGEAELETMSTESLEKYEKSLRPADYSGAGGFYQHSSGGGEETVAEENSGAPPSLFANMDRDRAAKKQ